MAGAAAGSRQESLASTPCMAGAAGIYGCNGIDLIARLPLSTLGGGDGNDVWGWTDPDTRRDFAIMGRSTGLTFVEITNPLNPVIVGTLPAHSAQSTWADFKTYDSYIYKVSEASGSGLQIFDLRQLVTQSERPYAFSETAWLGTFSNAHNITINEATGYAYVVGSNACSGGLYMVDLGDPEDPSPAGCFSADGYTHDAQCVIYGGPDAAYQGSEVCFASNEDTLTIVDVTDKANPAQISRTGYSGVGYSHQGSLTADHTFFIADDELDEVISGVNTRTFIWDVSDLDNPAVSFTNSGTTKAIDHNQYIKEGRTYQANYAAGLQVLNVADVDAGVMDEVANFDVYPANDSAVFAGAWSTYPFYAAGVVTLSSIDRGLFILGYAGESGGLHVVDLDGVAVPRGADKWRAKGKVAVSDAAGDPVPGALVTVRWSNGKIKTCTTGPKGRCKTRVTRYNTANKVGVRILDVELDDKIYASWLNEDAEGDTNGFRETIRRPAA